MNGRDRDDRFDRRDDDRIEDMGADRLLDRAIYHQEQALKWAKAAERNVDDAVRDLERAKGVHREAERHERAGEALERKEEAIEREALGDLRGTRERDERGRRDGDWDDRDGWRGWWLWGDRCLRDIDDWCRRGRDRDGGDWGRRFGRRCRDFDDHMRRWRRDWDGWDDRYGPIFDDWGRRWGAMCGRWDGRDWDRGDWRGHDSHFRDWRRDFDGFCGHWRRHWGEWSRRCGWRDDPEIIWRGNRSPGTELGGWR
jgi:hypothetical protein